MKKLFYSFLVFGMLSTACENNPDILQELSGTITGHVVKGAVVNAVVRAIEPEHNEILGDTVTNESGQFSIDVGTYDGSIIVCAYQGWYIEEATLTQVMMGTQALCGIIADHRLADTTALVITPWTHLVYELTMYRAQTYNQSIAEAYPYAYADISSIVGCFHPETDILSVLPVNPTTVPAEEVMQLTPYMQAGLLLGGLSQQAVMMSETMGYTPGRRLTALSVLDGLSRDLRDGIFDGVGPSGAVVVEGFEFTGEELRSSTHSLAQGLKQFVTSTMNTTGITEDDTHDFVVCLGNAASRLFGNDEPGYDSTAPTITIVAPETGQSISGQVTMHAMVYDSSPLTDISITSDNDDIAASITDSMITIHEKTAAIRVPIDTYRLDDGLISCTIVAKDSYGNTQQQVVSYWVNNDAPRIISQEPSKESVLHGKETLTITLHDDQPITSIVVTDHDGVSDVEVIAYDGSSTTMEVHITIDTMAYADGEQQLAITACDSSDNCATLHAFIMIDNMAPGELHGTVSLGSPVTSYDVTAYAFSGVLGEVLATATSEADAFHLDMPDTYQGPVALVITGDVASYRSILTNQTVRFAHDDNLMTIVAYHPTPEGTIIKGVSVHGLTTIASMLAMTYYERGDTIASAIDQAFYLVDQHVQRPDRFDSRLTPVSDMTITGDVSNDRLESIYLGLCHAGLERFGAEVAISLGLAQSSLTILDMLAILTLDLSNQKLDGLDSDGTQIMMTNHHMVPVTTDMFRWQLAQAIDHYVSNVPLYVDDTFVQPTRLTSEQFSMRGGFFDMLATDDSVLFGDDPPQAYDREAPVITIDAPTSGASVTKTVTITAHAEDDSNIHALTVSLCDDAYSDSEALGDDELFWIADNVAIPFHTTMVPDGAICLLVTATDTLHNTSQTMLTLVVDNHAPVLHATIPAYVNEPTVAISGTVYDSVALASVTLYRDGTSLAPIIYDTMGEFSLTMAMTQCNAGSTIMIEAVDTVGHVTTTSHNVWCDETPPTLAITTLPYTTKETIHIVATSSDNDRVAAIAFYRNDALIDTITMPASTFTYETQIPVNQESVIAAVAIDRSGLASPMQAVHVVCDQQPPTITLNAQTMTNTEIIQVSGTMDDVFGLASFVIYVDSTPVHITSSPSSGLFAVSVQIPCNKESILYASVTDMAGHQTSTDPIPITCDNQPPVITLLDAPLYQENCLIVEKNENENVKYDPVVCQQTDIQDLFGKTIYKYFNRLDYLPNQGKTIASNNLPALIFRLDDYLPDAITVTYDVRFQGTIKRSAVPLSSTNGIYTLPIAYQTIHQDLGSIRDTTSLYITITATDRAGNSDSHTYPFTMKLLSPPVFIDSCAKLAEIDNYNLSNLTLHEFFTSGFKRLFKFAITYDLDLPTDSMAPHDDLTLTFADDFPVMTRVTKASRHKRYPCSYPGDNPSYCAELGNYTSTYSMYSGDAYIYYSPDLDGLPDTCNWGADNSHTYQIYGEPTCTWGYHDVDPELFEVYEHNGLSSCQSDDLTCLAHAHPTTHPASIVIDDMISPSLAYTVPSDTTTQATVGALSPTHWIGTLTAQDYEYTWASKTIANDYAPPFTASELTQSRYIFDAYNQIGRDVLIQSAMRYIDGHMAVVFEEHVRVWDVVAIMEAFLIQATMPTITSVTHPVYGTLDIRNSCATFSMNHESTVE